MIVEETKIPDVKIITPRRFADDRGFFSETYSSRSFSDAGLDLTFVQDNHSLSSNVGTIRGLHFQLPPFAQDKLIRVVRGRILDVAVDLRKSSATFGQHVTIEISARDWRQVLIPAGFAHGFCTLEPQTEVIYKVTQLYSHPHDRGLAWDDPSLGVQWPFGRHEMHFSDKDGKHPCLNELVDTFA